MNNHNPKEMSIDQPLRDFDECSLTAVEIHTRNTEGHSRSFFAKSDISYLSDSPPILVTTQNDDPAKRT